MILYVALYSMQKKVWWYYRCDHKREGYIFVITNKKGYINTATICDHKNNTSIILSYPQLTMLYCLSNRIKSIV